MGVEVEYRNSPTGGEILFEEQPMHFDDPRDAISAGIATVFQDLAMIPLMSVSRNFFMGNEPTRKVCPLTFFDHDYANRVTKEEMQKMGISMQEIHHRTSRGYAPLIVITCVGHGSRQLIRSDKRLEILRSYRFLFQ